MKKLLVIAAHPDDELLGCGGTLLFYKKLGYTIKIIFLSDGESSRNINQDIKKKLILKRESLAKKVCKLCKFSPPIFGKFPDNRLDSVNLLEIVKFIENEIKKFNPEIILTHNEEDLNIDHKIACKAVVTATRPSTKTFVRSIYCFETPSSTENNFSKVKVQFNPNLFIDVSNFIEKKIKYLKIYKNEIRKYPHSRSLESIKILAKYRGTQIGVKYAEAFYILRKLKK
jgi:LmbE family N-acetylglucosaminyl deacetylase